MKVDQIGFVSPILCAMRRSRRHINKTEVRNHETQPSSKRDPPSEVKPRRSPKRARITNRITNPEPSLVQDIEDMPGTNYSPSPDQTRYILTLLRQMYGQRTQSKRRQPVLDSLIATILSQATTNANSSRAFKSLKTAYPTWNAARNASSADIADAIRAGGLADQKAPRILAILDKLGENPSLEHLRDLSNEQVKKQLCAFPGVGPKTAACVLMFNMQRAEFPVDTHVRRFCGRIGWTPQNATPEKVYEVMNACLPDELKYEMHVLLIEHGRKTCKARAPNCDDCALRHDCRFFSERGDSEQKQKLSPGDRVDVEAKSARVKVEAEESEGIKMEKVKNEIELDVVLERESEVKEEANEEITK